MIYSGVDNNSILVVDPSLSNYYPKGQSDFLPQIGEALRKILAELKRQRKDINKFCTPISLQDEVTKSVDFVGDLVSDELNRMLLVIKVTEFNGDCGFELEGTNNGSDFESIEVVNFTAKGSKAVIYNQVYKQYRLKISTNDITTYSADLIESSFYHAHLFLSLSYAYSTGVKAEGDRFDYKSKEYMQRFIEEMELMVTSYDEDNSGTIEDSEKGANIKMIELFR